LKKKDKNLVGDSIPQVYPQKKLDHTGSFGLANIYNQKISKPPQRLKSL